MLNSDDVLDLRYFSQKVAQHPTKEYRTKEEKTYKANLKRFLKSRFNFIFESATTSKANSIIKTAESSKDVKKLKIMHPMHVFINSSYEQILSENKNQFNYSYIFKTLNKYFYESIGFNKRDIKENGVRNGQYTPFDTLNCELLNWPMLNWSFKEIALFEFHICILGKDYHKISELIVTKSVGEVVKFYYIWKGTENYKIWKSRNN